MFNCGRCSDAVSDPVQCTMCKLHFHFSCSGITEKGYNKLGERKSTWRCVSCKTPQSLSVGGSNTGVASQSVAPSSPWEAAPSTLSLANIMEEFNKLNLKLTPLLSLVDDIRQLKLDVIDLKHSAEHKSSIIDELQNRVTKVEKSSKELEGLKRQIITMDAQINKIIQENEDKDQYARSKNIELKGIPQTANENLFNLLSSIGKKINMPINAGQIDFITRVQSREVTNIKPIIVCFTNKYTRDDFIAGARAYIKNTPLMAQDLGLQGQTKIFVNDHLTVKNKNLLSNAKKVAKERGYQYIWVKFSKIFVRKDNTSPVMNIKPENDKSKII